MKIFQLYWRVVSTSNHCYKPLIDPLLIYRLLPVRQFTCRFRRSTRSVVRYLIPDVLRVRLPVPGDDVHERRAQLGTVQEEEGGQGEAEEDAVVAG